MATFETVFERFATCSDFTHEQAVDLLSRLPTPDHLWTQVLSKPDRRALSVLIVRAAHSARISQDASLERQLLERANALGRLDRLLDDRLIELRLRDRVADPATVVRALAVWAKFPGFVPPALMIQALKTAAAESKSVADHLSALCEIYELNDLRKHLPHPARP